MDPQDMIDLFVRKSRATAGPGRREITVAAQERRGREVAAALGLTVRRVWREVGSASRFSKRKTRSADHAQALKALADGEVGALWVYRFDRWDREGAGAVLRIIEPPDGRPRRLLVDSGDRDQPGIGLDSSNPRDRQELIRRAEAAREEVEVLSQRVRDTLLYQRANGEWPRATAPYGYRVVELLQEVEDDYGETETMSVRKLARDTEPSGVLGMNRAELARHIIFTLPTEEGLTAGGVSAWLRQHEVPSPSGKKVWPLPTVRDMTRNPAYAGWQTTGRGSAARRVVFRDETGNRVSVMAPGEVPIVTDDELSAGAAALRGVAGVGVPLDGTPHNTRSKHLLTGLLRCTCGGRKTRSHQSYNCSQCPAAISSGPLERFVFESWRARLTGADPDDPLLRAVSEYLGEAQNPSQAEDSLAARKAYLEAKSELDQVWADRRAGLYSGPSEPYFKPQLEEVTAKVRAAESLLAQSKEAMKVDISWLLEEKTANQGWESASLPRKREFLRAAITEIRVARAPRKGVQGDLMERVSIKWADE